MGWSTISCLAFSLQNTPNHDRMNDAPATRRLGPDSEDDFASASEGEQYETMESFSPVTSYQTIHVKEHAHPQSPNIQPLDKISAKGKPRIDSSYSSPALANNTNMSFQSLPVVEKSNAPQQAFYQIHQPPGRISPRQYDGDQLLRGTRQFEGSRQDGAILQDERQISSGRFDGSTGHQNSSGPHNGKEVGGGWGSLSSWINTAVSTVSEVIENPNVVVSKAHTLGQGIRSVATEQIDKVYESLDPEYEYARERQSKQGWSIQHPQQENLEHERLQQVPDQHPGAIQPPTDPSSSASTQQNTWGSHRGGTSDLLNHDGLWNENHDTQNVTSKFAPQQKTAFTGNKLEYKEDKVGHNGDDWGEDPWGDDWDDYTVTNLIEESPATSLDRKHGPSASLSLETPTAATASIRQPSPIPLVQAQYNNGLAPAASRISHVPDNARDVRDLFSMGSADRTTKVTLTVSSAQGDGNILDNSTQRRSSSDIRPSDALFSTLDFASNALGSAVLGVHRKVTQVSQLHPPKNALSDDATQPRPASPAWKGLHQSNEAQGSKEISVKLDRAASANPSFEAVGGNVMSTGLGALEILGKKAVDVISDVRRAGHLSQGQGGSNSSSDQLDDSGPFKVPPKMNLTSLFEEAGSPVYLTSIRSIASASTARVASLVSNKPKILHMGQLDDLEQLLGPQSLESAMKELSVDLLAGHKNFRSIVNLLDRMGVQGTAHLRQLRICTKKLGSLVPDSVNAFEQEWHNHQSRASERDFFARAPIKKFFESRLLSIYFDGLRALAQFTDRTCHQLLRIADNFNLRLIENTGGTEKYTVVGVIENGEQEKPSPLVLAQILRQFLGSLIAEAKFMTRTYGLTLDSVLEAARGFTTPLDRLDWEDLSMGLEKIKCLLIDSETPVALGFIHTGAFCIAEVLKNELMVDAVHGKLVPDAPKVRVPLPKKISTPPQTTPQLNKTISTSSPPVPKLASSLSPHAEQKSGIHSPLLTPNSSSSLLTNTSLSSQAGTPKAMRPTTPVTNTSHAMQGSDDLAPPIPVERRPSSSSSLSSLRSTRAPPAQPKLSDEDFFSILNDTSG
ncbi:hypothetical protein BGX27_009791 [Mortierella sp. AM989]|nr:hypothetical protein BGX27_009791 [Mortierella sp. AM989]